MNRLGIHINLFQLFVMSTTHFSSPAWQSIFYVLWNPRNSHIRRREGVCEGGNHWRPDRVFTSIGLFILEAAAGAVLR